MIIVGILLLLLSLLILHNSLLTGIGLVLLILGVILNLVPLGGTRRRFY